MLTLIQAVVALDTSADVFDVGGTAYTIGALRYDTGFPYEVGVWLADIGEPLGWVDLLDLDPSRALLAHPDIVRPLCGCESLACPHGEATCATMVDSDDPRMMYIGAVCVPCADRMGRDMPDCVSAPYGTYVYRP
jgi:hypothetical protein